jgi:signal transduction histidine kinase
VWLVQRPLPAGWVHIGDVFRLGFAAALLAGAMHLARASWRRLDVERERRRLACDLHDGVVQELAFIRRRAPRLLRAADGAVGAEVLAAADRAALEARRAVEGLARGGDGLQETLTAEARHAAWRGDIALDLRIAEDVEVAPSVREALARIVGEAVTNAAQHARAGSVRVELEARPAIRLRVVDDGIGFSAPEGGFGLASMRERARAVGAALEVRSDPGAGTEIRVSFR